MEINVVELIVQAGAVGLSALLVVVLWKYGGDFVNQMTAIVARLMDNLDEQTRHYEAGITVQAEVAATLRQLCERLNGCESEHEQRAKETAEAHAETVEALQMITKNLRDHETRAQRRHEKQMEQAAERHAELVGVLKGLNGKS
jgi:hypothetical protein